MEASAAMSHISRRSPARMDVVSLLSDGGAMSQKEIVYMTGVSDAALRDMTKKGILRAEYEEVLRAPDFSEVPRAAAPVLSAAQQQAYDGMAALMDENAPRAALLFGVTGSGKTQVYLQLIAHALEQGKSAIVLVPEIGLTPQLLRQFAARFGEEVAVLHSALSAGERYDSFKKIKTGRARVVIGTRSAVFAPAKNLGVIIIDEEQDAAYRSEQSPRYHARDVAKYRAAQTNALLVLGSATPSVETYYGAKQGKYPVFALTERFLGAGLHIQVSRIDLIHIFHGFFTGVHKFCFHGFKTHEHARSGCHTGRLFEIPSETLYGLRRGLVIIYVIACQLDNADAQIICQLNGLLHNLQTSCLCSRIAASQRILPVSGQTHAADGQSHLVHGLYQLQTLFLCPVQTGQLVIGFVNADFHKIIAGLFRCLQLFLPGQRIRHSLFV